MNAGVFVLAAAVSVYVCLPDVVSMQVPSYFNAQRCHDVPAGYMNSGRVALQRMCAVYLQHFMGWRLLQLNIGSTSHACANAVVCQLGLLQARAFHICWWCLETPFWVGC